MHYSLLQRLEADVRGSGDHESLERVMESVFPSFRSHIEPDLNLAQVSGGDGREVGGGGGRRGWGSED